MGVAAEKKLSKESIDNFCNNGCKCKRNCSWFICRADVVEARRTTYMSERPVHQNLHMLLSAIWDPNEKHFIYRIKGRRGMLMLNPSY